MLLLRVKTCTKCGVEKLESDFCKGARRKDGSRGIKAECKSCANSRSALWAQKHPDYQRNWRRDNVDRGVFHKRQYDLRQYGLSSADYAARLEIQKGVCAICVGAAPSWTRLSVDHVHDTNPVIVRGLLCKQCNVGIGFFKDSPKLLFSAADYLRKADPLPTGLMPCY